MVRDGAAILDGDPHDRRVVAVELGMFAAGRVEVSGPGVTEGLTVGVPR